MLLRKFIPGFCLLTVLLLSVCTCLAQSKDETENSIQRIENNIIRINKSGKDKGDPQTLLSRMQSLNVPGVSIAVFDEGRIIWAKGYGFANKNSATPVDSNTIFQAASISKPLATVAMFVLAEKNRIAIDEDINQQLTSWKVPENDFTTVEKVTPKRIVGHMAGLSVQGFRGYQQNENIPTLLQVLDGTSPANSSPVRVTNKPGSKMIYSGGGFTVLQLLLQEKTGQSFTELMNDLVLRPAAMSKSLFALRLPDSLMQLLASGHLSNGAIVNGGYNIYPEQAAAGLWTTPSDLSKFMLNVGNSYRSGNGILQQSTVKLMFTKLPGGNGLGFGIEGEGNALRFSHLGGNVGFTCYAVSYAGTGRGFVIMTNSDNGTQLIREIARAIYREYQWPK